MRAQIVEHQYGSIANGAEQVVVGDLALWIKGWSQMVEEVRNEDPQRSLLAIQYFVGDRRREMRLPGGRRTGQHQPTVGHRRIIACDLQCRRQRITAIAVDA